MVIRCEATNTNTNVVTVKLPPAKKEGEISVEAALAKRRSVRNFSTDRLTLAEVGQLLWAAQGISSPDGRRTAPSAGATYPLEVYLICGAVSNLPPGVYRYQPESHQLVRIVEGDKRKELALACFNQPWVENAPASLVITAVYERTTKRYGERAVRYVHLEAGHAIENAHLQAVGLGLGGVVIGAFQDEAVSKILSLGRHESPICIFTFGKPRY
jgi:SagB-type dehydrogenase family enzyme